MNYILKHLKMFRSYAVIGFKVTTEYKFQFITNFISYIISLIIWIFLWDLVFAKVEAIGQWNLPMMIMMIGFFQLNDALWQFCFYTVGISRDIVHGRIDKYLVRPVNPLYGTVMERFQVMSAFSLVLAFGIIFFAIFNYYSLDIVKLFLALTLNVIAVGIIQVAISFFGALGFWYGSTRSLLSIYRGLRVAHNFPLDILERISRSVLTFIYPAIFVGTYPVLMMVEWDIMKSLKIIGMALIVLIVWSILLYVVWKKGVRRYESFGG